MRVGVVTVVGVLPENLNLSYCWERNAAWDTSGCGEGGRLGVGKVEWERWRVK